MDVVFEFWPISARIRCRFRPGHRFRPVSGGQSIFYLHFGSFCFEHLRDVPSSCFSFSGGLGISPQTGAGGEGMGKSLRWYDKFALLHSQDRLQIRIDGREGSSEGGGSRLLLSPRQGASLSWAIYFLQNRTKAQTETLYLCEGFGPSHQII